MIPTISDKDFALIKHYVILPMVLQAFERDTLIFLNLRSPKPYVDWIYAARERLSRGTRLTRYKASERGIQIYAEEKTAEGIRVRFMCRGVQEECPLTNAVIADEAAKLMHRYLTFDLSADSKPLSETD